jgi:hypothetical protein
MKVVRPPFTWLTLIHDFNAGDIRFYDVLNRQEAFIKKLKKKHATKEEFARALRLNFKRQYWARCEYEMIIYIENDKVYLEPWVGEFKAGRVDITDNELLDWPAFAKKILHERSWHDKENNRDYVKFDIFDQLMFRFDELVDFVWNYKHKYQRLKKGN